MHSIVREFAIDTIKPNKNALRTPCKCRYDAHIALAMTSGSTPSDPDTIMPTKLSNPPNRRCPYICIGIP